MNTLVAAQLPILVVEDDLDMQYLIRENLRPDSRLKCVGDTTSALEALTLTKKLDPVLVILDHKLEGEIMGLQAAPKIKSISPKIRIILFTVLELSYEANSEPAIDLYLPKSGLEKLLGFTQKILNLQPIN